MTEIGLYDIVELVVDVPGTRFKAGMTGTVIEELPGGAWEIEFEEEEATGEIVTRGFRPEQLRLGVSFAELEFAVTKAPAMSPAKKLFRTKRQKPFP